MSAYAQNWFLVARDECGTEAILHPEPGETKAQVRERMPEEWSFRFFEEARDLYSRMAEESDMYDDYDNYGEEDY